MLKEKNTLIKIILPVLLIIEIGNAAEPRLEWFRKVGGKDETSWGKQIIQGGDNHIYASMRFMKKMTLPDRVLAPESDETAYSEVLLSYTEDGDYLWACQFDAPFANESASITIATQTGMIAAPSSGVYVSGFFGRQVNVGSTSIFDVSYLERHTSSFMVHITGTGNESLIYNADTGEVNYLRVCTLDADGNIICGGGFHQPLRVGNLPVLYAPTNTTRLTGYNLTFSPSGEALEAEVYHGDTILKSDVWLIGDTVVVKAGFFRECYGPDVVDYYDRVFIRRQNRGSNIAIGKVLTGPGHIELIYHGITSKGNSVVIVSHNGSVGSYSDNISSVCLVNISSSGAITSIRRLPHLEYGLSYGKANFAINNFCVTMTPTDEIVAACNTIKEEATGFENLKCSGKMLLSFNTDGELLWCKELNTCNTTSGLCATADALYMTGSFWDTLSLDTTRIGANGTRTGFVAKFSYERAAGKMHPLPNPITPRFKLAETENRCSFICPSSWHPSVVRVFNSAGRLLLKKTTGLSGTIVVDKRRLERGILFFTVQTVDGMEIVSVPNIR